jgi:hypothetical protein
MPLNDLLAEIESTRFAVHVGVASDFATLIRGARAEDSVNELLRCATEEEQRSQIMHRAIQLARRNVDIRYENPSDTALTVYLWVLMQTDLALSQLLAGVFAIAPQLWWAKKLSLAVLDQRANVSEASTTEEVQVQPQSVESRNREQSADTVLFPVPLANTFWFRLLDPESRTADVPTIQLATPWQYPGYEVDSVARAA